MPNDVPFSMMLASSVHDIKNSLGMLLNTLDSVIEATPNASDLQRSQFGTLRGEAARINNSMIYLLGLYRLQEKQLPLQIQEIFVDDFLEEQIAANELLFSIRQLRITCECDEDLRAYFDPTLIAGILNNVLVNASRYANKTIRVIARPNANNGVVIEVRDDGPGFPEKMLSANANAPQDQFANDDRGIDFHSGSTSLGLYFAAQVANLHCRGDERGTIELTNQQPNGSCFRLVLP